MAEKIERHKAPVYMWLKRFCVTGKRDAAEMVVNN